MAETMLSYVKEEPEILNKILQEFDSEQLLLHLSKPVKKILILATGSSYNAALAAKCYLEETANIIVNLEEPFNFQYFGTFDPTIDCIIAISQSGRSTSTINALKKIKDYAVPIIAITNQKNSILAIESDYHIDLNIGIEKVEYVTKGFSGTILNLFMVACTIGYQNGSLTINDVESRKNELRSLFKEIPSVIERTESFFLENSQKFTNYNRFVCIAYGANLGIAKEFETKFTETVRLPSSGYELEAYMHGPYLEAQKNHALFFLIDDQLVGERAFLLRDYMDKYVGSTITVVNGANNHPFDFSLNTACSESNILPLLNAVLVQVWSYLTAKALKQDLSIDPFPDFDAKLNSKLI